MRTLLLNATELQTLLSTEMALNAVEQAFAAVGRDEVIMPPKTFLPLEHHDGAFHAMPAYVNGAAGVKWVGSFPQNVERHGMPSLMAVYVLSDPATGAPLAIMDATRMTAFRAGAAAAIASSHLAPKRFITLGVIGCGALCRQVIPAHRALFPNIEVQVADISRNAAERLADELDATVVSLEEAAACEVVCTTTPSTRPSVRRAWVRDGAHINAMGADAPGKQELDPQILLDARVYVDDLAQALVCGEIHRPVADGIYSADRVIATLGEVVAHRAAGRQDSSLSVFDATGLAVQDAALARAVYDAAVEQGRGTRIALVS